MSFRGFWSKKPDLLSQLLPTLQAYGYDVQQEKAGEWWICKDGQVWVRLSNSSSQWCIEVVLEDKNVPQVRTLLALDFIFRETCGFPITCRVTSRVWEKHITGERERRAALAALSPQLLRIPSSSFY